MATSSTFARGYLRKIWRDAQASGKTLLSALEAAADAAQAGVGAGKTIQATTGNGRSVTYQVNTGDATPADIYELTSRLLDYYDTAHAHLFPSHGQGHGNNQNPHTHTTENDQAIFDHMMSYLVSVRSFSTRFLTVER